MSRYNCWSDLGQLEAIAVLTQPLTTCLPVHERSTLITHNQSGSRIANMSFDINESLKLYLNDPKSIQTPEAAPEIIDADGDGLETTTISDVLEPIREAIHDNPDAIAREAVFDTLQCLLK